MKKNDQNKQDNIIKDSTVDHDELLNMEDDENGDDDISKEEKELLDHAGEDDEERELHSAELDDRDDDGELLNEGSSGTSKTGSDLDIPGGDDDDDMEDIGEEDEENNGYSVADTE